MKFLIINPWIYDSAAYDFWLKPLGLLYISSILKKEGHEVHFIDLMYRHDEELEKRKNIKDRYYGTGKFISKEVKKPEIIQFIPRKFKKYGLPEELFEQKLKEVGKVDAILVGVTMTYWYYGAKKTIDFIRKIHNDTKIYLGGIYTNIYTEHAKKTFKDLNVKVLNGTGLIPIKNMLKELNYDLKEYNWFEELDPDYSVYNGKMPYAVITASIGCPYNCSYCVTHNMWKYNYRSKKNLIKNIYNIKEKWPNLKNIVFFDDAFLLRRDLKELLKDLANIKVNYHLPNGIHAHRVNQEISDLLKNANFKTIKLGYETSDPNLQKNTGAKVTNADLINAVNCFKKSDLDLKDIGAYIISNLPGQKIDDIYNAIDFCFDLGIQANVNEFTPIPGTEDYKKMVKNKQIQDNLDPLLLNNTFIPYWWDKGMTEEEISKIKLYLKKKRMEVKNE
ncbi:MAG: hypothetical protein PWP28_358 [Oceanotoga sp.]|uniref:B12-binding domain-containing radical SAM protein n=1 Tax=Oceanotoga sp. TaxID=2108366 RepID=UPI0026528DA0|nr:radical SAM protein [Oceanotoga sp.]MDN5341483.1 hypothetical protein [Oceanotoga sp.]